MIRLLEVTIQVPNSIDPQYYGNISSTGAKPFILSALAHPSADDVTKCRFYDDTFLPDYHVPARLSRIKLIKGEAIQLNRPLNYLRVIEVGNGIFLSKQDYVNFIKIYHSNLIGDDEPFPTEYLVIREEDYVLTLPSGMTYNVAFAESATVEPVKLQRGEWSYTLRCKFRIIPTQDEQEEL